MGRPPQAAPGDRREHRRAEDGDVGDGDPHENAAGAREQAARDARTPPTARGRDKTRLLRTGRGDRPDQGSSRHGNRQSISRGPAGPAHRRPAGHEAGAGPVPHTTAPPARDGLSARQSAELERIAA
ncbi:MAG: hypothetical protein M3N47_11625, partial [Chloroflexota bacterium]|nr:hypothetical protein [Chloroflexota bacterium]